MQVLKIPKNLHTYNHQIHPHEFLTLLLGNKQAKHHFFFILPMQSAALRRDLESPHASSAAGCPWQQQALSSCSGRETWAVPSPLGIPWVPKMQQEQPPRAQRVVGLCKWQHLLLTSQTAVYSHWLPRLKPRSLISLKKDYFTNFFRLLFCSPNKSVRTRICCIPSLLGLCSVISSVCSRISAVPVLWSSAHLPGFSAPWDQTGHCTYYLCLGSQNHQLWLCGCSHPIFINSAKAESLGWFLQHQNQPSGVLFLLPSAKRRHKHILSLGTKINIYLPNKHCYFIWETFMKSKGDRSSSFFYRKGMMH